MRVARLSFLRFFRLALMSLSGYCPEDVVSIGVLEEVSSLSVSFNFNVSASNKLSLCSVWVPVVAWRSFGILVLPPGISFTSTVLVAWDWRAGLVFYAVSADVVFLMLQWTVGTLEAVTCSGNAMVSG